MREIRNTKIIAVDHGYGNISSRTSTGCSYARLAKTANTITPTGIAVYETEPIFTGNILEYNGTYYRIGEGWTSASWIERKFSSLATAISVRR